MDKPYIESSWTKPDTPFEIPLRPQTGYSDNFTVGWKTHPAVT